jgi:hypothetical protein
MAGLAAIILTVAVPAFVSWATAAAASAAATMAALAPVVGPILAIGAAAAALYKAYQENFLGIRDVTDKVIKRVQDIIESVMNAVRTFWDRNGEQILAAARRVWEAIQSVIDHVTQQIQSIVQAFQAAFRGDWETFGEKLREVWDRGWQAILTVLKNLGQQILSAIQTLISNTIQAFRNTDWGEVGRAIIQGVAWGISASAHKIADAAKRAARAALDAAKGFLGIGSPSKAFLEVGANVSESFAQGIEGVMPDVAGAMQGLRSAIPDREMAVAGARAGRQGGLAMAGGRGGEINFNVTFGRDSVRSDDDIEEIMRRFEQILNVRGVRTWEV